MKALPAGTKNKLKTAADTGTARQYRSSHRKAGATTMNYTCDRKCIRQRYGKASGKMPASTHRRGGTSLDEWCRLFRIYLPAVISGYSIPRTS